MIELLSVLCVVVGLTTAWIGFVDADTFGNGLVAIVSRGRAPGSNILADLIVTAWAVSLVLVTSALFGGLRPHPEAMAIMCVAVLVGAVAGIVVDHFRYRNY